MASADKSRQSSGRSFFSRGKNKEKHYTTTSDEGRYHSGHDHLESGAASRASHHHRNSSTYSVDRADTPDSSNSQPGYLGAVPYDSVRPDGRPVPVDYLPNPDQPPARREPMPHQLNKNNFDFHQYPSFDPSTMSNPQASHHSVARLPHHPAVNLAMASSARPSTSHQQQSHAQQYSGPGAGRSSLANSTMTSAQGSRYESYINAGRSSGDNASIFSGIE